MVPTANSTDMARRIPGAQLVIYEDAGHGGIFQNPAWSARSWINFSFEKTGEALASVETGRAKGKVVIAVKQ
jgi:pimeloyl-ACP methyl ester carboxylesterase